MVNNAIKDNFIQNGEVKIHTLSLMNEPKPIILFIPGMFGTAEDCLTEFKNLSEFNLVAMSVRGRGQSSSPKNGYTFADQVSDVCKVIESLQSYQIVICAHSYGCLLAVAAASLEKQYIKGLIMVEKGVKSKRLPDRWRKLTLENPPPNSTVEVVQQVFDSADDIDLTDTFKALKIPTLFFKGETKKHALKEEEVQELIKIEKVHLVRLKNSGHWPSPQDYPLYISEIKNFLNLRISF